MNAAAGEGGASDHDTNEGGRGDEDDAGAPSGDIGTTQGAAGSRGHAAGAGMGGSAAARGGASGRASEGGATSTSGASAGGSGASSGGSTGVAAGAAGDGTSSAGGVSGSGASATGGTGGMSDGSGGMPATGGTSGTACSFSVASSVSPNIATVGVVDWSTSMTGVASARVVYTLDGATTTTLDRGGTAPVDASEPAHHTLLLGLKPARSYTFHVEVDTASGTHCASDDYELTTGTLSNVPAITRSVTNAAAQAPGFVIVAGGFGSSVPAVIIDADGDVVWAAPEPTGTSRARMDYEGKNMWMLSANATNAGGDLRFVSMDGTTSGANFAGLEAAHHDFAVLPGGAVAVLSWAASGLDQESDLLERLPDGTVETLFHVGSNLYAGGQSADGGGAHSYHANSVAYHTSDDSFTIGDRNPSSFVKVSHDGTLRWQFGGSCKSAEAPLCVPGSWQVNHGHQLLDDGTFLFFNNTGYGQKSPSNALEFMLQASSAFSASELEQWSGSGAEHSDTLGDVQRLPNGNTLVTFSNEGVIYELDPTWHVVQTLSASSFGYSDWRPTLYGPPSR